MFIHFEQKMLVGCPLAMWNKSICLQLQWSHSRKKKTNHQNHYLPYNTNNPLTFFIRLWWINFLGCPSDERLLQDRVTWLFVVFFFFTKNLSSIFSLQSLIKLFIALDTHSRPISKPFSYNSSFRLQNISCHVSSQKLLRHLKLVIKHDDSENLGI